MPSSKYLTDRFKAVFLLWIVLISYASCWCMMCCCVYSKQPCGHLLGKGLPLGCPVCCFFLCFVPFPNVSWSESGLRARSAPLNWFKPSSKIFYRPFQGGTYFVHHLCFCVLRFSCFRVCSLLPCCHLLGKG